MSIFGKLFGQTAAALASKATQLPIATEQELLERYAGTSFEKQASLYDAIGDNGWNANLDIGEISFGDRLKFPVQTLGTYSHQSGSWLWAWANKKADWPASVRVQSEQLKLYGASSKVDIFQNGSFTAPITDAHLIGLIASGLFNASAYYLADYGQGAMLFTIQTDQLPAPPNEHARVLTVIPQMISTYEMNHKNAVQHYLLAKHYAVDLQSNQLSASKDGQILTAQFDSHDRLINCTGQMKD
jgi:hypothetical protein